MADSLAICLLLLLAGFIAYQGSRDSAAWDEVGHFAAGLESWRTGTFRLYRVNPPLVRLVASSIAAAEDIPGDPDRYERGITPCARPEYPAGAALVRANGRDYFGLLTVARWECIPFVLIGGWVCYIWAYELYGMTSGLLAVTIWTFSPTIIAFGHLITPDVAAASGGVLCAYTFWRWLRRPIAKRAVLAGVAIGFAECTKMTWLILFPLFPIIWFIYRRAGFQHLSIRDNCREFLNIALMFSLAILILNCCYLFEGSFTKLGQFQFVSPTLRGPDTTLLKEACVVGNRFRSSWAGQIPVPVPRDYLLGIDAQKSDFDHRLWSYLRGEWRLGGWWYYYLYAMLVKEPLGTWVMGILAMGAGAFSKLYRAPFRDELVLLAPATAVIVLVSSQVGFNHHLRYVLPAFPFLFILVSRMGRCFERRQWSLASIITLALAWAIFSSLSVFPHSLSYFNELAGGPKGGHWQLGNSNADWGQDLLYLRRWLDHHPYVRPLHLAYDLPIVDPRVVGVDWLPIASNDYSGSYEVDPQPGWFIISVNQLHREDHQFDYFNEFKPVDWIGYTMPVYHVSLDDANRLRRKYKLPQISAADAARVEAELQIGR